MPVKTLLLIVSGAIVMAAIAYLFVDVGSAAAKVSPIKILEAKDKYATKARNGFWHSFYFTTGGFPEPIRIGARNREITEGACRHCHAAVVDAIDHAHGPGRQLDCIRCHQDVGHAH